MTPTQSKISIIKRQRGETCLATLIRHFLAIMNLTRLYNNSNNNNTISDADDLEAKAECVEKQFRVCVFLFLVFILLLLLALFFVSHLKSELRLQHHCVASSARSMGKLSALHFHR